MLRRTERTVTPEMVADGIIRVRSRLEPFYSVAEVEIWMHLPHPQLDGATAIDTIRAGGVDAVLAIIERLEAGAYL